jgi:hypothetical protein
MVVRKPNMDEAKKRYEQGVAKVTRIPVNHADPIYNVAVALENFTGMLASIDNEIAIAVGDIQDRLERLEAGMSGLPGRRP